MSKVDVGDNNPFLSDFRTELRSKFSIDRAAMSMADWVTANTTLNGKPFTFDKFPFQVDIINDMHPSMCVKKISQVGLSEVQYRKSLGLITRNVGLRVIFTLPDDDLRKRMAQTRVLPIVDADPVFNIDKNAGVFQVRSSSIIQVGMSFMYMTGDNEKDATSTSADVVMNDEVDLSNQTMLALFSSRMQGSDWKVHQEFSTPTFSNYGIDQSYQASDQREYMHACHHCNHWSIPMFNEKFVKLPGLGDSLQLHELTQEILDHRQININTATLVCEKCGRPLDLRQGRREWVPRLSSRYGHGYWVRPFTVHQLSPTYILNELLKYRKRDFIRGWYNTVLGETYDGGDARLSATDIRVALTGIMAPQPPLIGYAHYIGIDLGLTCHIAVGAKQGGSPLEVLRMETCPADQLIARVTELDKMYQFAKGGCDRDPYTPTANELLTMTGGRIMPMQYRGSQEINDRLEAEKVVRIDRTEHLDTLAAHFRKYKIRLAGYGTQEQTIIDHLQDMVRIEEPERPAYWKKLNNNDHYFHALAFLTTAVKLHTGVYAGSQEPYQGTSLFLAGVDTPSMLGTNILTGQPNRGRHGIRSLCGR